MAGTSERDRDLAQTRWDNVPCESTLKTNHHPHVMQGMNHRLDFWNNEGIKSVKDYS